ncbi:MAG: hypothetical protein Q8O37_07720 [Sulfuricellaceae bacterium]|nr:hypothetical protein [Sulfuricellaceae bacterium]
MTGLARIYLNRGHELYEMGLLGKAEEDFSRSLAQQPDYGPAYHNRGMARFFQKNYPAALADFDAAILLTPDQLPPYAGRAMVLDRVGRKDEASKAYAAACKLGWKAVCKE